MKQDHPRPRRRLALPSSRGTASPASGPGQPAGSQAAALGAVATSTSAALGAGHVLIPAGRGSALQHSAALALTQAPATPGSCTCSRTGPRKQAAVGTDGCPLPPPTLAT